MAREIDSMISREKNWEDMGMCRDLQNQAHFPDTPLLTSEVTSINPWSKRLTKAYLLKCLKKDSVL